MQQQESDRQNIRLASNLISSIDRNRDSLEYGFDETIEKNLAVPISSFFQRYRMALERFLQIALLQEIPLKSALNDLELKGWAQDAIKNHKSHTGDRAGIHLQMPVVDVNISREKRLFRLKWIIEHATAKHTWASFFKSSFDWEVFGPLLDSRSLIYKLKNSHHISEKENDRTPSLEKAIIEFVGRSDYTTMVVSLSKQIFLFERMSDKNHDFSQEELDDFTSQIHHTMRLGKSGSESAEVLAKMEKLTWGPENYVRANEVIQDARNTLNQMGALVLTSWGGAGKTALANKLTYQFAQEEAFQKYALFTTKIESNQKTLSLKEGVPTKVETTSELNAMEPLRFNGDISGSFRRVCLKIIQTENPTLETTLKDSDDGELTELTLNALCNLKFLVVLDNFEDIENPGKSYFQHAPIMKTINNQFNQFRNLINEHERNYRNGKSKSCFIVTTRGQPDFGKALSVKLLDRRENYDLLRSVLLNRVRMNRLSEEIIQQLSNQRPEVDSAFDSWIVQGDTEEFRTHPLNVIFAGQSITNEVDIVPQVRKWNPKNMEGGPDEIAKYCTREMLNTADSEERMVLLKAAEKGQNKDFKITDFLVLSDEIGLKWNSPRALNFVRNYSQDRQWFVEHPTTDTYRWAYNIYLHLRSEYFPEQKEKSLIPISDLIPVVRQETRVELARYINFSSRSLALNRVIDEMLLEKHLPDELIEPIVHLLHHDDFTDVSDFEFSGIPINTGMRQFLVQLSTQRTVTNYSSQNRRGRKSWFDAVDTSTMETKEGKFLGNILPSVIKLYKKYDAESKHLLQLRRSKSTYDSFLKMGVFDKQTYFEMLVSLVNKTLHIKETGEYSQETYDYLVLKDLLPSFFQVVSFSPKEEVPTMKSKLLNDHEEVGWKIYQLYRSVHDDTVANDAVKNEMFWFFLTLRKNIRSQNVSIPDEIDWFRDTILFQQILSLQKFAIDSWIKNGKKQRTIVEKLIHQELFSDGRFDCLQIDDFSSFVNEPQHVKIHLLYGMLNKSPYKNDSIIVDFEGMEKMESEIVKQETLYRIIRRSGNVMYLRPLVEEFDDGNGTKPKPLVRPILSFFKPHDPEKAEKMDEDQRNLILREALLETKKEEISFATFLFRLRNKGVHLTKPKRKIERLLSEEMGFFLPRNHGHGLWIEWPLD